jgi:S1-C subfamily serine protease
VRRGGRSRTASHGAGPPAAVLALLPVLAATWAGCADSSSPPASGPRVVSMVGTGSERATGFTVAPGKVVTVAHAVEPGRPIRVRAGRAALRSARLLHIDRRADLALLAVPGLRGAALGTAAAGDEDRVSVAVLRSGRVATIAAEVRRAIDARVSAPGAGPALRRPALELEARVRAGDSGAPVLTEDGDLAGVLFARSRNRPDTAYAVAAQAVGQLDDAARR